MLDPEQLFLLEFLVDSVYIHRLCGKEISNRDWLLCGQTVVSFQFLNFQPQAVADNDFPNPECPGSGPQKFESGKSCLFSIPEKELYRAPGEFIINIAVYKKQPAGILPECVQVGEAKIDITNEFTAVVCDILRKPHETPASNAIKDTFVIHTPGTNEPVGMIRLFIRLSCFGKSIVTEFSLGNGEQYLFRGNEDSLYRCQQVKRSNALRPPCGVTIDTCPAKGGPGGWPMFPEAAQLFPPTACPGLMASSSPPPCPTTASPPCAPIARGPCPTPAPPPCPNSLPPICRSPPPPPCPPAPCPPPPVCPMPPPPCPVMGGGGASPCPPPPCPPASPSCPAKRGGGGMGPAEAQRPRGAKEQCVGFIPCRPLCTCRKADASTSMTDVGEDRPKSASVLKKGSLARGSMKPKKGSLKPRKSSKTRKKSRSSSRSSRVSRPSNRPSSAPSLRGSVRSSKSKKSWTFPPLGGKPISRVDFAGSMKPVWSQSPEVETFYSRKSNVEKRPHSASLTMKKAFSETVKKRPSTVPMQKPSIRAWRRRVRGILSSSSDFDVSSACCPNPQIPNRHPYRNVPAYVDLASFLYPDYFWTLVDHFLQNQEWPRWATLEPSFQKVCAQFNIDGSTTLHMVGFAPLWVNLLRQTDEVMFRTVVGHFFFAHKFPSWSIFPRCILEMFQNAGIKEYDYAN